jgi:predicted transposase YdaD
MDMITTIAVYKFVRLSRAEVEAMIGLRLEDTRVYQEAKLEGEQSIILRLLCRHVGNLSNDVQAQIKALPLSKLEALGEAMLDFSNHEDLVNWLQAG